MNHQGWIGVDLDATLARYEKWEGIASIGDPIPAMVKRIKDWLREGIEVRIMTARVYCGESGEPAGDRYRDAQIARTVIEKWCAKHIGVILPVTCCKDMSMIELWDDRCVQVAPNTGESVIDRMCSSPAVLAETLQGSLLSQNMSNPYVKSMMEAYRKAEAFNRGDLKRGS